MNLAQLRQGLHVSISQLKSYLLCPRRYELQYVRGIEPAFVPINLAFGSAFHAALGAYYGFIKETGAPLSLDEMASVLRDAWETAAHARIPLQADDEDGTFDPIDKGVAMLTAFYGAASKKPMPDVVSVERGWAVDLYDPDSGGVLEERLVGAFDLVVREGDRHVIVEHKTAARKYGAHQLAYDHQLTAYHLAATQLGLGPARLRFQVVTKAKLAQVQIEEVSRDASDVDDFLRTAVGVLRAIDAGAFYPIRGWQCRGCQYAHACAGAGR